MNSPRITRLPFKESCQFLLNHGCIHASDYEGGIPTLPSRRPEYDDESPLGVTFYKTWLGNGQPFGLAMDPKQVEELEEIHLENLTLPRTFFGRSEISRISFRNTDLSESTMCWNDFIEVNFTDADLSGSDLRASKYERVAFVRANLRNADLRRSSFEDCDFAEADLTGAMLSQEQAGTLPLTEQQMLVVNWQQSAGEEPDGG